MRHGGDHAPTCRAGAVWVEVMSQRIARRCCGDQGTKTIEARKRCCQFGFRRRPTLVFAHAPQKIYDLVERATANQVDQVVTANEQRLVAHLRNRCSDDCAQLALVADPFAQSQFVDLTGIKQ